jgi:uncharacterized membrane protein (UPF0182 family)
MKEKTDIKFALIFSVILFLILICMLILFFSTKTYRQDMALVFYILTSMVFSSMFGACAFIIIENIQEQK